eukprot:1271_1
MTDVCCKSILADMSKIINNNVAVMLKWKTPDPSELRNVKATLDKYSPQINNMIVNTNLDHEDNPCSVTILHSKLNKHKIRECVKSISLFKIDDRTRLIVSGFIHILQKQFKLPISSLPDLFDICCIYYDCYLHLPIDKVTPMTLLFTLFDLKSVVDLEGWEFCEISRQREYLQPNKIHTQEQRQIVSFGIIEDLYDLSNISSATKSRVYDDVLTMLSMFWNTLVKINCTSKTTLWNAEEVVISFVFYLLDEQIENYKTTRDLPTTWQLVEYLRRYCMDLRHYGTQFNPENLVLSFVNGYNEICSCPNSTVILKQKETIQQSMSWLLEIGKIFCFFRDWNANIESIKFGTDSSDILENICRQYDVSCEILTQTDLVIIKWLKHPKQDIRVRLQEYMKIKKYEDAYIKGMEDIKRIKQEINNAQTYRNTIITNNSNDNDNSNENFTLNVKNNTNTFRRTSKFKFSNYYYNNDANNTNNMNVQLHNNSHNHVSY